MKVKSESEVAQSCPTLCDPMDCSPPGSSVPGISQARVLAWGAQVLPICPQSWLQQIGMPSCGCFFFPVMPSLTPPKQIVSSLKPETNEKEFYKFNIFFTL